MKRTFRRRRHTSNWVYIILAVCFLLVTLCIISLIPGSSDPSPNTTEPTAPGSLNDSATEQATNDTLPDPCITITINKEKFAALVASYQANPSVPSASDLEEIRLQFQELALSREQLTAEQEEFRVRYETASEELAFEKEAYLQKQQDLKSESERLTEELNQIETLLAQYDAQIEALDADRKKLSEEEKELQETEAQLQHLNEDITHAREQLTAERRELEADIQNIKNNPNLSSESKETALIPLYAALEQLLMREAQLEHSEAEYEERSEALLAKQENLASRLQSYESDRNKLDETLAPHKQAQQKLTSDLQAVKAKLPSITIELERIGAEESVLEKEYQDKLTALDAEEARITEEEQNLKKQAAALQVPPDGSNNVNSPDTNAQSSGNSAEQTESEQAILEKRTLERILIILQEIPLTEGSNFTSDILLTDVADIMITTP